MKQTVIVCAALFVSLFANAQTSDPAVPLSSDELVVLFKGKTIATDNTRWGLVSLQLKEDGTLYGTNNSGRDSGKWRIENGKLCLNWQRWDYEGCGVVRKVGAEIQHLWPKGSVHFVHRP